MKTRSKGQILKNNFYLTLETQVVEMNETSYKVALGCALGIGINFLPTLGIGFLIAFLIATLLRFNRASAAATSLLTGPLVPVMYAFNFVVGGIILTPALSDESYLEFILRQYSIILRFGNIQEKIYSFLDLFGSSFLLGAVINAAFFGLCLYFLVPFLLRRYKTE